MASTTVAPCPPLTKRLAESRGFLVFVFLLPAGFLLVFLTYPLGLGIWLAFTDTDRPQRQFVGLENFEYLCDDAVFWQAVFYSVFYTVVATREIRARPVAGAAAQQPPAVQSLLRAIILLPWIVPTVLSAIAFWWIYDPQFSIISYVAGRAAASATSTSISSADLARRAAR